MLCNACGSRWRLKGSLDDYVPKRYRAVVRKRRFQNIRDVHEEERIVHTGEVTLGDLNLTESFASNKNKSSPESITSEFHQLIKLKAVAASKYSGHPYLFIKAMSYDHGVLRFDIHFLVLTIIFDLLDFFSFFF